MVSLTVSAANINSRRVYYVKGVTKVFALLKLLVKDVLDIKDIRNSLGNKYSSPLTEYK